MSGLLVSVIIPAYNAENEICRCIESVINQTYSNFEIIVVDDGSEDDTIGQLLKIKAQYQQIDLKIFRQANLGPSKARNYGISVSKGDLIAFLDADDEWYSNKLQISVETFSCDSTLFVLGSFYSVGDRRVFKSQKGTLRILSLMRLLMKNSLITSATVCRSEVFKKFIFNEQQKYSEDYRLWLEICAGGYKCGVIQECLVRMCDKPIYGYQGLSSKLLAMEKGELQNYLFLYRNKQILLIQYIVACFFSICKYLKRQIITWLRLISF